MELCMLEAATLKIEKPRWHASGVVNVQRR